MVEDLLEVHDCGCGCGPCVYRYLRYAAGLIEFLLLTHKEEKPRVLPSSPGVFCVRRRRGRFRVALPIACDA